MTYAPRLAALAAAVLAAGIAVHAPARAATQNPDVGSLRGQVRAGARPVAGATAAAVRAEAPACLALTATDADGFLSLDGVHKGTWSILLLAPGFVPESVKDVPVGGPFRAVADFMVERGSAAPATLVLPRNAAGDGTLRARIVDAGNEPLAGVRVRLEPRGHRADPIVLETSETGEATAPSLPPGNWRVSVGRAGWTRVAVPAIDVGEGGMLLLARLLPLPAGAATPVEDLLPPPRFLD